MLHSVTRQVTRQVTRAALGHSARSILAVEGCFKGCSVAMITPDMTELLSTGEKSSSSRYIPQFATRLLQGHGALPLLCVVNCGPGAFTGIRSAISFIQGLSAPHQGKIQLKSVSSNLLVLHHFLASKAHWRRCEPPAEEPINSADAQGGFKVFITAVHAIRGTFYTQAFYEDKTPVSDIIFTSTANTPEAIRQAINTQLQRASTQAQLQRASTQAQLQHASTQAQLQHASTQAQLQRASTQSIEAHLVLQGETPHCKSLLQGFLLTKKWPGITAYHMSVFPNAQDIALMAAQSPQLLIDGLDPIYVREALG